MQRPAASGADVALAGRKATEDDPEAEESEEASEEDEDSQASEESQSEERRQLWQQHFHLLTPKDFIGLTKKEMARAHCEAYFSSYGVSELGGIVFLGFLAAWHSFGMWLTACMIMGTAMQILLQGYVAWLMDLLYMEIHHEGYYYYGLFQFFAVLLKSWFMLNFFSDLVRFCFWLARDAWRNDAFEAYRRALCGMGDNEMKAGQLYGTAGVWTGKALTCPYRLIDATVQLLLYFSLDVLPFLLGMTELVAQVNAGQLDIPEVFNRMFSGLTIAGLCHVLLFWFAWVLTDFRLKYRGYVLAKQGNFKSTSSLIGAFADDWKLPRAASLNSLSSQEEDELEMLAKMEEDTVDDDEEAAGGVEGRAVALDTTVANKLNICVKLCTVSHTIVLHCLWIVLFIVGILLGSAGVSLVFLSLFLICYDLLASGFTIGGASKWLHFQHRCPRCWHRRAKRQFLWHLQKWGDICLGLEHDVQFERRVTFGVMVALHAMLFAFLNSGGLWTHYLVLCLVLLLLQAKLLTLRSEIPWGWFVGICEAALIIIFTMTLILAFPPNHGGRGGALFAVFTIFAHQCGLQRKGYFGVAGYRVVRVTTAVLMTVLLVTLLLVLSAKDSMVSMAAAELEEASIFDCPSNNCSYFQVEAMSQERANKQYCGSWIELGTRGRLFPPSDFLMFATLAYEPESKVVESLQQWFPGWQVTHTHTSDPCMRNYNNTNEPMITCSGDWTSFYDFTDAAETTTVFAVRGTASAIDALNDMVLFMPAVIMQGFSFVGFDVSPATQALADLGRIVGHQGEKTYKILEAHVIEEMKKHPERQFFIAGHSLGGGLSKLVSQEAYSQGLMLPAITFMSPGLAATMKVVGEPPLRKTEGTAPMFTLQPDNDIVSRLDQQTGLVVPIACPAGSPLDCHLTFKGGLCRIFDQCGSGRDTPIRVPCSACPGQPGCEAA